MTVKLTDDMSLFLMAAAVAAGAIALNAGCASAPEAGDAPTSEDTVADGETSSAIDSTTAVVIFPNGCSNAEKDDDHYEHVKYSVMVNARKKGEYAFTAMLQTAFMPLGTRDGEFDTVMFGLYNIEERTAKEVNSLLLTATSFDTDTTGVSITALPMSNDCIGPSVEILRSASCTRSGAKTLTVTAQKSTKVAVNVYDHAGNLLTHSEGEPKPARTTGGWFWKQSHPEQPFNVGLPAVQHVGRIAVIDISDDQPSGVGLSASIAGDCE